MTREIRLTQGYVALVDDADFAWLSARGKWSARTTPDGRVYAQRATGKTTEQMHRLLVNHPVVDHINGDGLDNRRENLRPATTAQNNANARLRKDNKSGFKGVSRLPSGRWTARLGKGGAIHLGTFATPEEAARAYDAAALIHFGEYARINFKESA